MIIKQWIDSELHRAVRKALDFWYDELSHYFNLLDFIHQCHWKKRDDQYVVIFRGPKNKDENII